MWQVLVMALMVATALSYVVWKFTPLARRQTWLDALASRGVACAWATRHRAKLASPGCHQCAAGPHGIATKPGQR